MKYVLILLLGFSSLVLNAQTDVPSDSMFVADSTGKVEVIVDGAIAAQESSRIYARTNITTPDIDCSKLKIEGYRIMLGFDPNRANASRILANANAKYGGAYPCVIQYDEPNFKVFMGEFVTYAEASRLVDKVRKSFPLARTVNDKIKAPQDYCDKLNGKTEEDE